MQKVQSLQVKCPFTWAALLNMCLRVNHFAPQINVGGYRLMPKILYCNELSSSREIIPDPRGYCAHVCLSGNMRLIQRREHNIIPGSVWISHPVQNERWIIGPQGLFYFYIYFTLEPSVQFVENVEWPVWSWAIQELAIGVEESQQRLPGWPERAGFRASAFLSRCFTLIGNQEALPPSPNSFQFLAEAVERYCLSNLAYNISLQEIADHLGISVRTLVRRYQQETGTTVIANLSKLRLHTAADMLRHTELALTDIASQVGIPDKKYLSRLFVRQYGMSPMQYRRNE